MGFGYLCNFGITSSPTHHYQYDDVGNRTPVLDLGVTKSYGANSVNAYTSISGFAAPVHDANGNMNSGPLGVVGAATSALKYGKENNNLLSALGTQATNFVYDAIKWGQSSEMSIFLLRIVEASRCDACNFFCGKPPTIEIVGLGGSRRVAT